MRDRDRQRCAWRVGAAFPLLTSLACGSGNSEPPSKPDATAGAGDARTIGTHREAGDVSTASDGRRDSRTDGRTVKTPPDAALPSADAATPGLTKVATGEYETFYLVDGVIWAYGAVPENFGLGSFQGIAVPPMKVLTPAGLTFLDVQGGLHQSMALDVNHRVWTWGVAALSGSATPATIDTTMPYMITQDNTGATFDDVIAIEPTTSFDAALKSDGTVWVWGDCSGGVLGAGVADAGATVDAPTQVPIPLPTGVTITKISGAVAMLALASDGGVWAWGFAEGGVLGTGDTTDGNVPRQVMGLPGDIVDIVAGGGDWFLALTSSGELYGWGYRNPYLGIPGYAPVEMPISLTSSLHLKKPVVAVAADSLTTHVILSDGTLWAWGDASNGGIGDGQEPNWVPTGCGWDFMTYDLMVYAPVQIAPSVSNFTKLFANSAYDSYDYALTASGDLYSWGRNKTATLGNGVVPLAPNGNSGTAADIAAYHPNSWDVPLATRVTPFTTPLTGVLSPCCPDGKPDASGCM
jgi:alpha-tubulin suppressor-like RCC1 family protein